MSRTPAKKFIMPKIVCADEHRAFITLLVINKAIADTQSTKELADLYEKRVEIYQELGLKDQAFNNLKLARAYGKSRVEQKELKSKCLNIDPVPQPVDEFLRLSYQANPKLPQIADCLKLGRDDKNRKIIVTAMDLKAGDIVGIIDPFFKFPFFPSGTGYFTCNTCLKSNLMDMIPCKKCRAGEKKQLQHLHFAILTNFVSLQQCSARKIAWMKASRTSTDLNVKFSTTHATSGH